MKKYLVFIGTAIMLTMLFVLTGCSSAPKGDPSEVLNNYYQYVKDTNYEGAYETLSTASRKNFSKEDYVTWASLRKEVNTIKSFKVEKLSESKNIDVDGVTYKNVVEFNVTETVNNSYENKEENINYKRDVVNDNGVWKVYRGKEDGKELIAEISNTVSYMYIEGKGKTKDLNQAATILNDGIKSSQDFPAIYYTLATVYKDLGRYDEGLSSINTFLSKDKDNKEKSDGYNVLGTIYSAKQDIIDAKAAYTKALELNPDNQYAKTNLASLN